MLIVRYTTEAHKWDQPPRNVPRTRRSRCPRPAPLGRPSAVSSARDQGALQSAERVLSKGALPTEARLPLRDRVPRQPQPSCLRSAHREETTLPVHENGGVSGSDRPSPSRAYATLATGAESAKLHRKSTWRCAACPPGVRLPLGPEELVRGSYCLRNHVGDVRGVLRDGVLPEPEAPVGIDRLDPLA